MRSVDTVFTKIAEGATNAEKALLAFLDGNVGYVVGEFDVRIEHGPRLAPAQGSGRPELGTSHLAGHETFGAERIRREITEFILPETYQSVRPHLQSDQAERRDRVALTGAVCETWAGIEFTINGPDLAEWQFLPITGHRRRRTPASSGDQRVRGRRHARYR